MDKIFLRLISSFNPVLERAGVDTAQLSHIFGVKLLIDGRRPSALFSANRKKQTKATSSSSWLVSFMTILMGIFMGLFLFITKMPFIGQTLYFIIFMVMMTLTLISDFTAVLIDSRDHYILLPRPVNDRTLTMARILHISIYILRLAFLQSLPGMIMVAFAENIWAVPVFLLQIIEATFITILLVNTVYLLMMKLVSPQRFKDIISYFQIGFSVMVFASYYLLPRLVDANRLQKIDLLSHGWAYALPPVWITALNEVLIHHDRSNIITSLLAILGFILPVAGMAFVAKVLAPGFNRQLAVIATSEGSSDSVANTKKVQGFNFWNSVANFVAPDTVENAGFRITWKLAARTREFKMKVYPAFAYVPIYFLYFGLNGKGSNLGDKIDKMQSGHTYVFLVYLCTFILSAMLQHISHSDKYKSSWVYYALPVKQPGKILSGMYKALVTMYFLPYCLVLSVGIILIWGPQAINDIILAFLVSLIYGMLMALFMVKGLPFSKPVLNKQSGGKFFTSLMIMVFIGAIGFGHYYLMKWETVIWVLIVPAILINWIMFHYYKKQTWANLEQEEL